MKTTQIWALIQEWMDAQFFTVTQAQLAQKVGVSRSALSQWKTGQARPKPEHLMELHRVTRIDYDLLVEALVQDLGYRDVKAGGRDAQSNTAPNSQAGGSPDDGKVREYTDDSIFGTKTVPGPTSSQAARTQVPAQEQQAGPHK